MDLPVSNEFCSQVGQCGLFREGDIKSSAGNLQRLFSREGLAGKSRVEDVK